MQEREEGKFQLQEDVVDWCGFENSFTFCPLQEYLPKAAREAIE
jgi:hypothetical protein